MNKDLETGKQGSTAEEMERLVLESETMPTVQQEDERAFREEVIARRLSLATPYPPEVCLLSVDGVPLLAKGDLSAIKAKQKQGKTTAISLMVAAMVSGQWGRLRGLTEGCKVLFIDTEQKAQDTQQLYRRVVQLAGQPEVDDFSRLQVYTFRTMEMEQMLQAIGLLVRQERPDVVLIDGIVDLIHNFNEVEESQQVIKELMKLASADYSGQDVAIVCVLHENKLQEDKNMRGHLGTMLSQKAGIVLECVKRDDVFTVRCSDSRHQPVPEWSFLYDREGRVVSADEVRAERLEAERELRRQLAEQRQQELRDERFILLKKIVKKEGGCILRQKLAEKYAEKQGVKRDTATRYIKQFVEKELFFFDGKFIRLERPTENQLNFSDTEN